MHEIPLLNMYYKFDYFFVQLTNKPGTFLRQFIEYALLNGSGGTPHGRDQGCCLWQKMV